MLRNPSAVYDRILGHIKAMPVVDCHEHLGEPGDFLPGYCAEVHAKPIRFLAASYFGSDLWSAGASDRQIEQFLNPKATTDELWPVFKDLWSATEHTAYARVTKLVLKEITGSDRLTRESLDLVGEQLSHHDHAFHLKLFRDAGIKALLTDVLQPRQMELRQFRNPELASFLKGEYQFPDQWHPAFSLGTFFGFRRREFIDHVEMLSGLEVTSMAEYEQAVYEIIRKSVDLGVVALKVGSAYRREISFDLPARCDAERIFNKLLVEPRNELAWPDAKPLDDYLFHQFMRFARELDLPVQIHTGHLARIRNRVQNANAAHLASVLELHRKVRFDLFHGNWPYMGDLLFLGKNYPNVIIDLCWVHMIDPLYSVELIKRAVMTVPHVKIHGFGGDFACVPQMVTAHLTIAREVIAAALADLVESGWLGEETALGLAVDWLFNNPNNFYGLGLQPVEV